MDKLLEPENSKQVTKSTVPTGEHTVVEKTVNIICDYLSRASYFRPHPSQHYYFQMADSYMEEYLPLKSSPELLEEYIFFDGRVRLGKILEGVFNFILSNETISHADNQDKIWMR
jgi:acyl-coenzyme A thioesterase 9